MRKAILLSFVATLYFALPATADDVLDQIDQARSAYEAGDFGAAKQYLETASQLVSQKNAEGYVLLFPDALSGWSSSNEGEGQATAFGVTSATRSYIRNSDGANVEISITGDSALLSPYFAAISNPAISGAMGKLVLIEKFKAIQTEEGDLQIVVKNNLLISVTGSAEKESKLAYAKAINYSKLPQN